MIVISHRGNIDGPNPKTENKPHQIEKVIYKDFLLKTQYGLNLIVS